MRALLILLVAGSLGALFYYQKNHEPSPAAIQPVASQSAAKPGAAAPAPSVSEHNWMKRSLDRATEVRNQARTRTEQSQDP